MHFISGIMTETHSSLKKRQCSVIPISECRGEVEAEAGVEGVMWTML